MSQKGIERDEDEILNLVVGVKKWTKTTCGNTWP